jgi:hypothetical protein
MKRSCIGQVRRSKATHRMKSGMGGSFDVRIVKDHGDTCDVQIDMPRNPDWDGIAYDNIKKSDLKETLSESEELSRLAMRRHFSP